VASDFAALGINLNLPKLDGNLGRMEFLKDWKQFTDELQRQAAALNDEPDPDVRQHKFEAIKQTSQDIADAYGGLADLDEWIPLGLL
jgi:hypothetical protein